MLIQILEAVGKVLGIIQTVQGIVSQIKTLLGQPAQEPTLTDVAGLVAANHSLLTDSGFGLAEISSAVAALTTLVAHDYAALVTQIGNPQQQGSPVTLPASEPPGWITAQTSDVWGFQPGNFYEPLQSTGGMMAEFFNVMKGYEQTAVKTFAGSPFFGFSLPYDDDDPSAYDPFQPQPLIANVRTTDTVLSWLQREWPALTWQVDSSGQVFANDTHTFDTATWYCIFTNETLQLAAFGTTTVVGALPPEPPVWPGFANVTLGSPLALADGLLVPGPLHGVIVDITSVPYPISYYPFGPIKSFVKVGGIVFVDDNAQGEFAQALALDSGVICPKTMVVSDHARLRLQSGVVGTVTPWTRN